MSHYRTITAVVEIPDDSALRYTGHALTVASTALESAGFTVLAMRNEHNEDGELPPAREEDVTW